ncbi:twin-arginine translocase TatA/TatE family subunit [Brachybacterium sp. Z12]|uniref:twin-arginine translocase TatA/TatE family subunit n=1 Tax=Brachybacterium sp. Z12 TaxID=2759167 RepID=UPI00223B2D8D|nr:twin-arginine translocase TatA/TatE family subunit [Brachybacterium sp. Z12]
MFGANKLPGLARNMGKSMRIFKSEVEELRGDEKGSEDEDDERPTRAARPRDDRADDRRARDEREYDPVMTPNAIVSRSVRTRMTTPTVATEHLDAERVVDSGSARVTARARSAGRKQIRGE